MAAKRLKIVGGGPAGLACGIRLRELGIEVELYERQRFPPRKVCGEFLSPAGWRYFQDLGASALLAEAPVPLKKARFYWSEEGEFSFEIKPFALGLTRGALDSALAARLKGLKAKLHEGRAAPMVAGEEWVDARGRTLGPEGPWKGWKAYASAAQVGESLEGADLVMAALKGGYAGASWVEGKKLSVCLLHRREVRPEEALGSHPFFRRLIPSLKFHCAVAGFDFKRRPGPLRIGDAAAAWPPLAGDGISRALGEGIALAEGLILGRKALAGSRPEFFLSKAMHSLMLSRSLMPLIGPFLRLVPALPSALYRLSRV